MDGFYIFILIFIAICILKTPFKDPIDLSYLLISMLHLCYQRNSPQTLQYVSAALTDCRNISS